jgi:hypothetical protein
MTADDRLIEAFEHELARFDLDLEEAEPEYWHLFAEAYDPVGLWHPTGWVPVPELDAVVIEPTIFCTSTAVLGAAETRQYLLAVSLVCAAAIRPMPGGTTANDPESVMASFVPGGLDLLSKVAARALELDRQPCPDAFEPSREVVAEVGLDMEWSGFRGTIVEIRSQSVLLQLLGGRALVVPAATTTILRSSDWGVSGILER